MAWTRRNWKAGAGPLAWIVWIFLCAGAARAQAPDLPWPAVATPREASRYWIAPNIIHNTIPMRIFGFDTKGSLESTRRFYEQWFSDKRDFSVTPLNGADVLGARVGDFHVAVELRRGQGGQGTSGRVTSALVYASNGPSGPERVERLGQGFPRPAGTDVLSDTISFDTDRRNRTLSLRNGMSVETNALYLREHLILSGWTLIEDRTVRGGVHSSLIFRKTGEELIVNISARDGDCYLVASQTTQGN